jgi:hypothetical protein
VILRKGRIYAAANGLLVRTAAPRTPPTSSQSIFGGASGGTKSDNMFVDMRQGVPKVELPILGPTKRGLEHTREPRPALVLRWRVQGRRLTHSERKDVPLGRSPRSNVLERAKEGAIA